MRMKYSWIFFIPVAIVSVVLRVYQLLFVDKGIDKNFLNSGRIWLVYAGLVALLYIVLLILCVADKKTSQYYQPKSNLLAGVLGILSAGTLIFNAGMQAGALFSANATGNTPVVLMINAIFGILGGVILLLMGISSFSGKNLVRKTGIFSSLTAIWACIQLVTTFISYTKHSIHEYDMTNLFYMAFLTLALLHLSMMYQGVAFKNTVKGTLLYGMPGFVTVTVYTVADALKQYDNSGMYDILGSLDTVTFMLIGLYILCMMIEMTVHAKSVDTEMKTDDHYIGKGSLQIEEKTEYKDEVSQDKLSDTEIHTIDVSDVEDDVNKDLDEVDSVIENMEKEAQNPENYSPWSEEYFNREINSPSADGEIEKSLEDIDKLIDEISLEDD